MSRRSGNCSSPIWRSGWGSRPALSASFSRLSVRKLSKAFGPTRALVEVSLEAAQGEVHAVLGENGAGKSTLMGVLSGALVPDAGEVFIDGGRHQPTGPRDARLSGVGIVYQEPQLCPHLSVAENVLLGDEPIRVGLVDRAQMRARVERALGQVAVTQRHSPIRPEDLVMNLSASDQQLVEIARALAQTECRLLILDEPTSRLAADDVERLFAAIRRLRESGTTVLYVSHFLEEVQRIADRFTVLRDGRAVGSGSMSLVTLDDLVRLMGGQAAEQPFVRSARQPGEVLLELRELGGVRLPRSASLTLARGEVVGIAGLVGSGRTELLRAIFGLDPVRRGSIRVLCYTGPASAAARLQQGVGLLSEDRKQEGLAFGLSVADNLTLSRLGGLGPCGLVLPARQHAVARHWVERLGIRCLRVTQPTAQLSGGNQQKLALARLLYHDVDVVLLDEPTRGIDVASRSEVYRLVDELALRGKAVLMVSSYLPELLGVCDRVAVMHRGVLGSARPVGELSEHALLKEATGA
jgi:ribose transport system ATP-binding protein